MPSGEVSTIHRQEYGGEQLLVVAITFLSITYLAVSLRFFVRIAITKAFSYDDLFLLAAQVVFTCFCIFVLRGVHYGMGHHNASLPQAEEIQGLKYLTLATLTYIINMMFIKLSIAIFLHRMAVQRRYLWILRCSMVIVTIWSLSIFFYETFSCTPVAASWDYTIVGGHCFSGTAFVHAAYSISVMTIISDWMFALIPIPMLWGVQMSAQKKFSVAFILSLGVLASIATLVRLSYLLQLADASDYLYTAVPALLWTTVEPGVAITAASLVAIRPLLRALRFSGFDSDNPSGSHDTPLYPELRLRNDVTPGSYQTTTSCDPKGHAVVMVEKDSGRTQNQAVREDAASEDYILQGSEEGIWRTMDVTVCHDAGSERSR